MESVCPICDKPARQAGVAPFCSARCREVDLYKWLNGSYRVKTDEKPEVAEELGELI